MIPKEEGRQQATQATTADGNSKTHTTDGQPARKLGGSIWEKQLCNMGVYLHTDPPSLSWFAQDRLLANRAHLLTGIGGASKTTCLYHLGVAAVTGRLPWSWSIRRTGRAILVLAEDDKDNVHRAIHNIRNHGNLSDDECAQLEQRLKVFPMAGESCRLLTSGPNGTLKETDHAKELFELAKRTPELVFIGLDPALALTEGDELNQAHQRRLGEFVDRLALESGACVVLVSHAAKAMANADEVGSHNSRGGGAITDAVRGEYVLRTMTAAEAKRHGITDVVERKSHVQLVLTKGNCIPPTAYAPVWLKRGPGGLLSQVELEEVETGSIGRREQKALDILVELARKSVPSLKEWRAACIEAGIVTGNNDFAREKAMGRIRNKLVNAGLVEKGMGRGVCVPVVGDVGGED